MNQTEIIPLFPLGLVLFPEIPLPLHIFEDRYKQMIRTCLEMMQPFGVVYYEGGKFFNTGCSAEIVRVLKTHSDGRMDILCKGVQRFEIQEVIDEKAYLQANVFYFDDAPETDPESLQKLVDEGTELLKKVARLRGQGGDFSVIDLFEAKTISYLIAASAGFTRSEEQAFLEMKSTRKRLERGIEALYKSIDRIKLTQDIDQIIRRNGHLPNRLP